ncbi:replicative DNA helicase [Entomomonas sp. E2T0]|uniref:replicative DNA helicase n=1 Tax=Entomomonas sp. E2T0 TaxID=2930213 RepID=UPI00222843B1|nr:replicative DNA helicase [Entomomonas sp. E2T0]UYZ83116.1 replicative DNA helicase [Entomomonas sp. E2T0]
MKKLNIPYSTEAEQAVLGGLMLDNTTFDDLIEIIEQQDFYRHDHRVIFNAIQRLHSESQPFDVVTLADKISSTKQLSNVDNILGYVAELARNIPSVANIKNYAKIVKERSALRQIIQYSDEIKTAAVTKEAKSQTVVALADQKLFDITQKQTGQKDFANINLVLAGIVDKIDTHFNSGNPVTGVSTGLTDLDYQTSGLQKSDLIILAGRPSMGKTTLALQFALSAVDSIIKEQEEYKKLEAKNKAKDIGQQESIAPPDKKHILVFSLEMPTEQLIMRCIANLGGLNLKSIMTGQLSPDNNGINEFDQLALAINKINSYENVLIIDDSASLTTTMIRSKAKRAARKYGSPLLILIDYLQLISSTGNSENRNNEVSAITRALKALAKDFNCPVVALSQLNRDLEKRGNKRPVNADLRDSGAIEQDADVIMFIYRDEVYHPDSIDAGTAEIILGKHRNGPIGTVKTSFIASQTSFKNLATGSY